MRKLTLLAFAALAALLAFAPLAARAQAQPAQAYLRVIHAAAGAPGVDVYLNGQTALDSRDFFSEGRVALSPGDHEVLVAREGQERERALVGKQIFVEEGDTYTLALIGSGEQARGLLLKDRTSAPEPDEARVRIIHAVDSLGPVDIAVAGSGAEPFLQDAVFGSAHHIDVAPGTYAFDLSTADSGESLLQTIDLDLKAGWSYTLVVTGDSRENLWVQALVDNIGR